MLTVDVKDVHETADMFWWSDTTVCFRSIDSLTHSLSFCQLSIKSLFVPAVVSVCCLTVSEEKRSVIVQSSTALTTDAVPVLYHPSLRLCPSLSSPVLSSHAFSA